MNFRIKNGFFKFQLTFYGILRVTTANGAGKRYNFRSWQTKICLLVLIFVCMNIIFFFVCIVTFFSCLMVFIKFRFTLVFCKCCPQSILLKFKKLLTLCCCCCCCLVKELFSLLLMLLPLKTAKYFFFEFAVTQKKDLIFFFLFFNFIIFVFFRADLFSRVAFKTCFRVRIESRWMNRTCRSRPIGVATWT